MRYILLLRGINVGGKNKVVMSELKQQLKDCGFTFVESYINSGNLFFDSNEEENDIRTKLDNLFNENYDFHIHYTLLSKDDYESLLDNLPDWWSQDLARKDVLFYTDATDAKETERVIGEFDLHNELVAFTPLCIFWGKINEVEFLKTAYHKQLIKTPIYKKVTIRNGKTFDKLKDFVS